MKVITKSSKMLKESALYHHQKNKVAFLLKSAFAILLCIATIQIASAQKSSHTYFNNLNNKGVIMDGYDAVAFFTDNKPVPGNEKFQFTYQDAIFYFASQEHLDLFKMNPSKYQPQFGAWCAYAVSLGRIAPIDVNTFSIVDSRLVLQHNDRAVKGWNKDVAGNLIKADKYWPQVTAKNGMQITTDEEKQFLNNLNAAGVIIEGYDVTSYFSANKAVMGSEQFTARYNGATYWFASEANANLFKDNPEMFAPQYGGFCGYAVSLGKLRPVDPNIFQVENGRLILQHTQDAYDRFNKNLEGNIKKADQNWPGLVKKRAGKNVQFDEAAKPDNN
ncbi:MAG: YHS domain-containing (seleno)protein [Ferruginibacter sp.]